MKKELYLPYFKDKKITVLGLGLLGRGIGDSVFLASCGARLIVTDKKTEEQLSYSLNQLTSFPEIAYYLGGHAYADFENRDFILQAAGIPRDNEYILHAKEKHIPVYMSAALLTHIVTTHLPRVRVIGITGTRGKSTTTELIAHILSSAGKRVHRGGNIRGVANLPLLEVVEDGDYLVLELDSWQLQGFADMEISPHIAVFTSFLDDHMNYYNGDKEIYFQDKAAIYRFQKEGDVLIASAQAEEEISKRDDVSIVVPEVGVYETKLIGEHNMIAISLAEEVAKRCELTEDQIREGVRTAEPVEGRLQYMGEVQGVHTYNDNNATTGDAVVAGIRAVAEHLKVKPILICGGADKGLPVDDLEKEIRENTKACILLAGTGSYRLLVDATICNTLPECIAKAFEIAEKGDVILFSPGFASFSEYFNNEYERNDVFIREIKKRLENK